MNLIQISERLKEAPDNLLMREVQAPTGQYPAYLIISEMTRRKKLREGGAPQQAPQTTVAEDMAQEGGLAATPQAMASTAGMDVNGEGDYEEQPVEMASGGIVAFKRGLGVRDQLAEDRYYDQAGFMMNEPGQPQANQDQYMGMFPGALRDLMRYSEIDSPEARAGIRSAGEERFAEKVPSRRQAQADRIAQQERAIEGERASNVNMALMEAGLGMMASRAPRGIQGVAEGGLKGLSALRSGKQEIKKSEAYLDQAKDNYAKAQELYDREKYAAGDKAVAEADRQRALGLAGAHARMQGISTALDVTHRERMRPMEFETAHRNLQLARDTYGAAVEAARLKPDDIRSQMALRNAQANLANVEAVLGGRAGRNAQPKPMTGPGLKGGVEGAETFITAANKAGYQIIGPNGQPLSNDIMKSAPVIAAMISQGRIANYITDPVSKKITLVPYGMQTQAMTTAPQSQAPGRAPDFSFNQILNPAN